MEDHGSLQVHGGVDLRLNTKALATHRRVPSDEALLRMAAHHKVPVPSPKPAPSGASPSNSAAPAPVEPPSAQATNLSIAERALQPGIAKLGGQEIETKPGVGGEAQRGSQVQSIPSGESVNIQKQAEANAVFGERCPFPLPHATRNHLTLSHCCNIIIAISIALKSHYFVQVYEVHRTRN